MWYLLTDRKLKGYQLYGPFENTHAADAVALELLTRGRIKGYTVLIAQVPPKFKAFPLDSLPRTG